MAKIEAGAETLPHAELFSRVRFVLCEPSHPGNIGAACRAIHTMGFTRLDIVAPRDPDYRRHPEAVAFATNSGALLEASREFPTLEAALEGVGYAFAMTGYDRAFGPEIAPLRECAMTVPAMLSEMPGDVAFVFGCERSGLTNEQLRLCQRCAAIPANPEAQSLNLAQSVQVAAYEAQMAISPALKGWQRRFAGDPPATPRSVEMMLAHLREAMVSCGALDPQEPKLMMERFQALFARARPTQSEIDMLRGVCAAIILPQALRAGRKTGKARKA